MATVSTYCKAYSLEKLRQFSKWKEENTENIHTEENEGDRVLTDNDYAFLHENFIVTAGIFKDEDILFSKVTPEWVEYCQKTLGFAVPTYESA